MYSRYISLGMNSGFCMRVNVCVHGGREGGRIWRRR